MFRLVTGSSDLSGVLSRPGIFDPRTGRLNVNRLRTNDTLRKDEWKELDKTIVDVARMRLNGVADLRSNNLVLPLGGIGTTISQYEKATDMTDAEATMSITAPDQEDTQTYELVDVPVPVFHKSFRLDARILDASRRLGSGLDTANAATAARKVVEKMETALFNGLSNIVVNASPLYGYTNHPNRNPVGGADWGTITNIYTNVNSAVAAAEADHMYGPFHLYVATTQFGQMREVYTDGSGQSPYERILQKIPQIKAIKPADVMTDGTAVLVQMTRDVVDMPLALDIVTIQYAIMGPLATRFVVMAVLTFRVKADAETHSGIVHITGI